MKNLSATDSTWPARAALCLAVLLAYTSVWPNAFVFDDTFLIVRNVFLRHWSSIPALLTSQNFAGGGQAGLFYRPVPMLLHFFVYQAFGPSTVAFHALNIILQALNACLLHHFGLRAGFRKGAAFAAALLWAVHPLHIEAIAYMSSTPELLWGAFCLLGLITLLPDFAPQKICLALVYFTLGLGSKETAVVFPALAVITLFFVSKDRAQISTYLRTWPLWLLAAGYAAIWALFIHKTGYTMEHVGGMTASTDYYNNIITRALTFLATLPFYARLVVWPAGLHMDWNFPVYSTLLAWQPAVGGLMALLACTQLLLWKRRLALCFGLLWFAIVMFPASGIAFPVDAFISEHWLYMPLMGLFLGAAQTADVLFKKKPDTARLFVLALALSLGITTFFQNEIWRNPETLYLNALRNGGEPSRLEDYMGMYYMEQQEFDKAAGQFQMEVNNPKRGPNQSLPHLQLAMALLQLHMVDGDSFSPESICDSVRSSPHVTEAIGELGKALQSDPGFSPAHKALTFIYLCQGNKTMADFHEKQAAGILQEQGGQ